MLSEKVIDRMTDVLADRINDLQTTIIEEIAKSIAEIGQLTPSKAHQLIEVLRYGGSYNNIINKIRQVTNLNNKQIMEIFEEAAKQNQEFAKAFYTFKQIDYIPYNSNIALQRQVKAMAKLTQDTYINLMNNSAFMTIENGKKVFTPLSKIYQETLDKAVTSLSMGQESFNQVMRKTITELSEGGIRTVDYASGRSVRLDSAVRMNISDGMLQLSNELQEQFGEEFGADGIEVSHHINSAPDHIDTIDGKQFFKPLNDKEKTQQYKVVKGKRYKNFDIVNDSLQRPVSTMNCRHYKFSIVLGVSRANFTDEEIEADKKKNQDGFTFHEKHYTMYERNAVAKVY